MNFEYKAKIYGYECDIYGHLNNANYQHIFEAARSEMLDQIGISLVKLLTEGIHLYVKKIAVDYLIGVPYGESIVVKSWIDSVSRVRSVWIQEIWSSDRRLMTKAMVEGVFAKEGKPSRISKEWEKILLRSIDN